MKPLKIFLLLLLTISVAFSSVNRLKKVDIVKGELRLQFTNTCHKNQIKRFALTKPYRLVFDLKNTRLNHKNVTNGFNKSLRIAQYKPNIVRIVIENDKPYSCNPYKPYATKTYYHIPLPRKSSVLPAKRYKKPKKHIKKKTVVTNLHKNEIIVIDAGHGGHDSGAVGGGKREKDVVLQIAKRLEKQLKKRGHPVYMTRKKDRFLKLRQRTKIADKRKAVVFVSIHANAVAKKKSHKVHGIETFFLQNTRDERSQRIAARENKSVLKGTTKLSRNVIIDSVLSGPKIVESNKLAIDVHRRMITNVRTKYKGVRDGGVRHAPFWVLVGASRPSILVEVGYISHPQERKRLFQSTYQELIAKGIAEGIDNYLRNRRKEIEL